MVKVFNSLKKRIVKLFVDIIVILGSSILVIPRFIVSLIQFLYFKLLSFVRSTVPLLTSLREKMNSYRRKVRSIGESIKNVRISKVKLHSNKSLITRKKVRQPKNIKRKAARKRYGLLKLVKFIISSKVSWYLFGLVSAGLISIPILLYVWYRQLPRPELLMDSTTKCTKILDRKLRLLYEICPEVRSDPVELKDVSKFMVDATLAVEDSKFYQHKGFRALSILRAAKETILDDNVQGGSTITQQLVKLTLLSPERTISRKIKELVLSLLVEAKFSKNEILEMYLNNAPYGGNIVGIGSASDRFYGKNSADLTLAEASMLAGLPSAPSIYSPFVNLKIAKERQKLTLERMLKLGFITQDQMKQALLEEVRFAPQQDFIRAPHFVDYVRGELERIYGKRYVNFGGLTVVTSLDLDEQDKVQEIITKQVEDDKRLNISNGAAVVLDARTGEIIAMVGSKDYFDSTNDGEFNAAVSFRQPGSSIKPVTYSLALMKGYKASTLIDDSPVVIRDGSGVYAPVNYDGRYHGKVTLRAALANSYNIPAVKVLRTLNIDEMVNLGKQMGLTTWEADGNYGLSITLGGKETRLLDLTNVFGTLARGGYYTAVKPFLSIRDAKGFSLYKYQVDTKRAISPEVAYIITNILSDRIARMPTFGVNNYLSVAGHTVAVKTGTTDLKRDNYTVGYTPSYVVGVWVGNNDNTPMNPNLASGLSGAAPAWNKIMASLIVGTVNEDFPLPGNVIVKVYKDCGNFQEIYVKGTEPAKMECAKQDTNKEKDKSKPKDEKKD